MIGVKETIILSAMVLMATILLLNIGLINATDPVTTLPASLSTLDPPSNTPSPSNYLPVVVTAVISALAVTIVGLIVASLKGVFKHHESSRMKREEKSLLDEIEKAKTPNDLMAFRKKLASEKAAGAISKEQFDFLEGRVDQRIEELREK